MIEIEKAAQGFLAAGSEPRLQVLRLLVKAGAEGLLVGEIQSQLGMPGSTLTHHLRCLENAGLIHQRKLGTSVFNYAHFDHIQALAAFLLEECCANEKTIRRRKR